MAGMEEVLERLVTDSQFRSALQRDPKAALAGYHLSEGDIDVLSAQLDPNAGASGHVEQRTSKSGLAGVLLMSLVMAVTVAAPASADPEAKDVTGEWRGFFRTDGGATSAPASTATLTSAPTVFPSATDGRRFSGRLSFGEESCTLEGTIARSMEMSATGDCGPQSRLVIKGRVVDENRFGDPVPDVFEGDWMLNRAGHRHRGDLVLLHDPDGDTAPLKGRWEGEGKDERSGATIRSVFDLNDDGGGTAHFDSDDFTITVNVAHNTVPLGDGLMGVSFVGGGSDTLMTQIALFKPGDEVTPATMQGTLALLFPDDGAAAIEAARRNGSIVQYDTQY